MDHTYAPSRPGMKKVALACKPSATIWPLRRSVPPEKADATYPCWRAKVEVPVTARGMLRPSRCSGRRTAVSGGRWNRAGVEPGRGHGPERVVGTARRHGPRGHHDDGRHRQADRVPLRPATNTGRLQRHLAGDDPLHHLNRRPAFSRPRRGGLERHDPRVPQELVVGRGAAGCFDHRPAVCEELPAAGSRSHRRRPSRRHRDNARAQAQRSPHGTHAGGEPHPAGQTGQEPERRAGQAGGQKRNRHPLPERGAVR